MQPPLEVSRPGSGGSVSALTAWEVGEDQMIGGVMRSLMRIQAEAEGGETVLGLRSEDEGERVQLGTAECGRITCLSSAGLGSKST